MQKRGRFGSLRCPTIAGVMAVLIGVAGFGFAALAQQAQTSALAIVQPATAGPSPYVLLAQANSQDALPNFAFGRVIPPANDTILKRDRQHPPAAIGFGIKIDPYEDWIVTLTQDVRASAFRLTMEETRPKPGAWLLYYRLDPCKAAGLDTPGTRIPVTYEFVFAASHPNKFFNPPPKKDNFILTLDRDTVKPSISSLKAPTWVYRDQTIQVAISATDVSDEIGGPLVWDSGLHVFRLEGPLTPGGSGLLEHVVDDSWPTTCNDKVKKADHTFSYTVPHSAQPGDEITLRAEVEDWTGNKSEKKEAVLKVAGDWYGTFKWKHICTGGGNSDETHGTADLTLDHDGRGNLTGTLKGSTPERKQTIPPCTFAQVAPATFSAKLVGSYTSGRDAFSAQATNVQTRPGRASVSCPGGSGVGEHAIYTVYEDTIFRDAFRDLRRHPDGSRASTGERTQSAGGGTCITNYSLTLRQAQN